MGAVVGLLATVFKFGAAAYSVYSAVQAGRDQKRAEKRAEAAQADRNARRNYRSPTPPVTRAYGVNRIGGPFMFIENLSDRDPVHFLGFIKSASHEIEGFLKFYVDDDELTIPAGGGAVLESKFANHISIFPYLGAAGQDVGAKLTALGGMDILETDTFAGMAGFIVETTNLTREFSEMKGNFSAQFEGSKVATDAPGAEYSTNPAWIAADYLRTWQGVTDEEIDADALAASAAICDEVVTVGGGGTMARYTCNGVLILTDGEHRENLRAIADAMAGDIVYSSGKWFIEAGAWSEPGEDDAYLLSDISGEVDLTLESRTEDRPNIIKGKIYSPEHHFENVEYPSVEWALEDGEPERVLELDLPMVNDHRQAQRIAKIRGNQARAGVSAVLPMRVAGLQHKPGDVATYELPRMGAEPITARIVEMTRAFDHGENGLTYRVSHAIAESSADDFAWDAATEEKDFPLAALEFSTGGTSAPQNILAVETSIPSTSTQVVVTWEDPTGGPAPLGAVRVRLLDGAIEINSYLVSVGVETTTFNESYLSGPLTVGLRAIYDDNSTSGEEIRTPT